MKIVRSHLPLILLLALCLVASLFVINCGGGGDDDDDGGDDDENDDDDDDDVDDDDDAEYDSLVCTLPDPEGIGEGILVGGGPISDTITVYVYDDSDCTPIEGASVLVGGEEALTDSDGKATIAVTKAAELVTAYKSGYWGWSYEADAAVMYFRIRPTSYGRNYTDSADGSFLSGGAPLGLENPDVQTLGDLLSFVSNGFVYAGVAIPGVCRNDILSTDFDGLLAEGTFELSIDTGDGPSVTELPNSLYVPEFIFKLDAFGAVVDLSMAHEVYNVPVRSDKEVSPIEGLVLEADIGAVMQGVNIGDLIEAIMNGGDLMEILIPLLPPLLNAGLNFNYVGADPVWAGSGAPNLEVLPVASMVNITVSGANPAYDYLGVMAAEIPNRALLPMGIGLANDSGALTLDYVDVPSADYLVLVGATDLIESDFESFNLGFAIKHYNNVADFAAGITFAQSDFMPMIDGDASGYDAVTGEIFWELSDKGSPDVYFIIYVPDCEDCPAVFAALPGSATSYQPPIADLGITPAEADMAFVLGMDMPEGFDANEYNPARVIGYDSSALNVWTNVNILDLFGGLL